MKSPIGKRKGRGTSDPKIPLQYQVWMTAKPKKKPLRLHGALVDKAKAAIEQVFSDTSVSQAQTIESLEELIEECRYKILAINT